MSAPWLSSQWLRALAALTLQRRPRRPAPYGARRAFRPALETLEDRCVPTASLVQSGTTLYAYGDAAGNNSFQFSESTSIVNNRPLTTYSVGFGGQLQLYTDLQITQILVLGAGTGNTGVVFVNDTYMLPGLSTPQQTPYKIVLDAGGGYLLNSTGSIFLQFSQFQSTTVYAGSADPSYLYTIAGSTDSALVTSGNYSYVTGNGEFHMIVGATTLYGFSLNATDQAYQYDTADGDDDFVASGDAYSTMSGSVNGASFMNIAVAFPTNFGIAQHSGDIATLIDSPGNDVFDGTATYSYMSGSVNGKTYFNEVQRFSQITAESLMGGSDFAYNFYPAINTLSGKWQVLVSS